MSSDDDFEVKKGIFLSMAPHATPHDAAMYLAAAEGDVEIAVTEFVERNPAPKATRAAPVAKPSAKPSRNNEYFAGGGNSSGQAIIGGPTPGGAHSSRRSGASNDDDDSEGSSEGEGSGAGGREGRRTNKVVDRLFRNARENGAEDVTNSGGRDLAFQGTGRRLGHMPGPSPVMAPLKRRAVKVRITFYANGFLVDDETQLRDPRSPEGQAFLAHLDKGFVPREISEKHPGADIEVVLVDRSEDDYVPPKYVAFNGEGRTLASGSGGAAAASPAPSSGGSGGSTDGDNALPTAFHVDESQEKSKVVLVLPDGTRMEVVVNPSRHTVNDLRALAVQSARLAPHQFDLIVRDFPKQRQLTNFGETIDAAKCRNGVVMVHKKA